MFASRRIRTLTRGSQLLFALLVISGCSGSEPAAASYSCAADQACPQGLGCDVELGVCRAAQGLFDAQTFAQPSASGTLSAADLDLDGRSELLLARSSAFTTVYSLDAEAGLQQAARFPGATWASVGDVNLDGRPDVLLGGTSFKAYRATGLGEFSPLTGESNPVKGQAAGLVNVTSFPIVARWSRADRAEPIIVKDVYHLGEHSILPMQVETFSSAADGISSVGHAELTTVLKVSERLAAIDFDGDGLDELWGIDLFGRLTQLAPVGGVAAPLWSVQRSLAIEDPLQIGVRDANGDGAPDLVGLRGGLVVTGATKQVPGRVHEFALPAAAAACAWIQLDSDPERELVCSGKLDDVRSSETFAFEADFSTDRLTPRAVLDFDVEAGARLVAADFDGNGLEDLAALGSQLSVSFGVVGN